MITRKIAINTEKLISLQEVQHVSELRHSGVPMRGVSLMQGVETGVLTLSDSGNERTYTWCLTEPKKPRKRLRDYFAKQYRVVRLEALGETWYEVQETRPYWFSWDTWTAPTYDKRMDTIKYSSLYVAEKAISFYRRNEKPVSSVISIL